MTIHYSDNGKVFEIFTEINNDGSIQPYEYCVAKSRDDYAKGIPSDDTLPQNRYLFSPPSRVVQIVKWLNEGVTTQQNGEETIKINYKTADDLGLFRDACHFLKRLLENKCSDRSDVKIERPEEQFSEIITAPKAAFDLVRSELAGIDLLRVTLENHPPLTVQETLAEHKWRRHIKNTSYTPSRE